MDLYLRKVGKDMYRVILKSEEDGDIELGSISLTTFTSMNTRWTWGIDTVIPMRSHQQEGFGEDLADCKKQFKAAWQKFAADKSNEVEFIRTKLAARR